ncbi:MAG: DUF3106 domain-containing protein [Acidobacteriota bacterium]
MQSVTSTWIPSQPLAVVRAMVGLGLLLASISPMSAQTVRAKAKAKAKARAEQSIIDQKQLRQNPPAALERFLQMTPNQRSEALAGLPPVRRKDILQRVRALELLSDEERQQLRGRYQAFAELPQPRRQAVRGELRNLRQLTPKERITRLNSEEIKQKFSGEELQLLDDVAGPTQ